MSVIASSTKPKPLAKSLEDLQQNLEQLKLNLDAAKFKLNSNPSNDPAVLKLQEKLVKDISRSVTVTQNIIQRFKNDKGKKPN